MYCVLGLMMWVLQVMQCVLLSLVMPTVRVLPVVLRLVSFGGVVHRVLVLLVMSTVRVPQVMLWWMASLAML